MTEQFWLCIAKSCRARVWLRYDSSCFSEVLFLQIFIPQRINCIFFPYPPHGVQHGDKYDQKYAADSDGNAVPGNKEGNFQSMPDCVIDHPGHDKRDWKTVQKPLKAIEEAFKVHHFREGFWRHTDGFEHGKFSPAQVDVGGYCVKYICRRNQGY